MTKLHRFNITLMMSMEQGATLVINFQKCLQTVIMFVVGSLIYLQVHVLIHYN